MLLVFLTFCRVLRLTGVYLTDTFPGYSPERRHVTHVLIGDSKDWGDDTGGERTGVRLTRSQG
eukprot:8828980-Pyramimonas_sp.AAC.1